MWLVCPAVPSAMLCCAVCPANGPCMLQALFSVDLPPGGKLPAGHRPVCNQTTIATLKDEVIIMNSLQKPKKITFIGR